MPQRKRVFVNNWPIFKWTDTAALTGMVAIMLGLYVREYHFGLVDPAIQSLLYRNNIVIESANAP